MIIALGGPSGVGKSWFVDVAVAHYGFDRFTADTTRAPRPDEEASVHFHFSTKPQFRQRILDGRFLDWDYVLGHFYGYRSELRDYAVGGRDAAVAVVARMAVRLKLRLPGVFLIFLDGDDDVLDKRVDRRAYSPLEMELRRQHRDEERDHADLFDLRVPAAHGLHAADVEALVASARAAGNTSL